MGLLDYLPHLIYSTALTSVSMHHLFQRKAAEANRAHVAAQISILEDLHTRLAAREDIPDREFDRLWRLARSHDVWRAEEAEGMDVNLKSVHIQPKETVGWREVLLGRRFDTSRTEELDRKDLEAVRMEVENSSGFESR
ncbi:hypothetical protein OH76DRAFT_1111312 [Lentinus brumalis]|uniref:Uncharacterized protein n=1 Tax=Lentinus brumalis TaxID=2498619 RepID=A0A371CVC0_9APHY|nr:hypothetical protein OH76DRAFT_1111312 [Polyporus brumalis]